MNFSDFTKEVLREIDFLSYVSNYSKGLKRVKSTSYVGISPFNSSEKTASFHVDPENKIFKCFSSGNSGGIVKFAELVNSDLTTKKEIWEHLGKFCGLDYKELVNDYKPSRKSVIFDIMRETHNFFLKYQNLCLPYLKRRGWNEDVVKKYEIGFCPNNKGELYEHLTGLGFNANDLEEYGLVYKSSKHAVHSDRFIIPIKNKNGEVISFTGRDITDSKKQKWLHGKTTPIFSKSTTLWGFSDCVKQMREESRVVVTEGAMDAIAVMEAGLPCVSILGASISDYQLDALCKEVTNLYSATDSDAAGSRGLVSMFEKLFERNYSTIFHAVRFPDKLDAEGYYQIYGDVVLRDLIENSFSDITVVVNNIISQERARAPKGTDEELIKIRVIRRFAETVRFEKIISLRSLVMINQISSALGMSAELLQDEFLNGKILESKGYSSKKHLSYQNEFREKGLFLLDAPIYEIRILKAILAQPIFLEKLSKKSITYMDFENVIIGKVINSLHSNIEPHTTFEVLKEKLSEEEYDKVFEIYMSSTEVVDLDYQLSIFSEKLKQRKSKTSRVTNILGRQVKREEANKRLALERSIDEYFRSRGLNSSKE